MATLAKRDILRHRGSELCDRDGERVGKIEDIYLDAQTDEPEWALVSTGLLHTGRRFVPLGDAVLDHDAVKVRFATEQIEDAPEIPSDGEISREQEAALARHYGFGHRQRDDAMIRSEEELRVGKANRETGRARLRKFVVTDQVEKTVPVAREEVRVEREPIASTEAGATTDAAIGEDEQEVVLHEEEAVVEKRTVPKERVRLRKETVAGEHHVSEEVRREQVEVDDRDRGT